jgi:hypothetical protein
MGGHHRTSRASHRERPAAEDGAPDQGHAVRRHDAAKPEDIGPKPGEITSFGVLVARLTWVLAGPLALIGFVYGIVSSGAGWLTGLDVGFAIVVLLMLLGRWVDQRSGTATTVTGEPATPAQLRRYVTILIPGAAVVWVVANVVGNHVLN